MSNAAAEAVIQEYCRELKLAGVVRDYPGLCRRARDGGWAYEDLLRELLEAETGRPASLDLPCLSRGATTGYHPQAYEKALVDVKAFLSEVFGQSFK